MWTFHIHCLIFSWGQWFWAEQYLSIRSEISYYTPNFLSYTYYCGKWASAEKNFGSTELFFLPVSSHSDTIFSVTWTFIHLYYSYVISVKYVRWVRKKQQHISLQNSSIFSPEKAFILPSIHTNSKYCGKPTVKDSNQIF